MLTIDGSQGEGGGQILRTSLALALVTGQPFRIERIRAGRKKPGLLRQHRTAVLAAQEIGAARVSGAELGSLELEFQPGRVRSGEFHFAIGSAGSVTLVLQTVLPALLQADGPSVLVLEGGTHNPFAPPFEFLAQSFAPLLERMGPRLELTLERHGFHPAGGGRMRVAITPCARLAPLELRERGAPVSRRATAILAHLDAGIARRELEVVQDKLGWRAEECTIESAASPGPGNALVLAQTFEHVCEVVTSFGQRGVPAPEVGRRAVHELRRYLAHGAPVGEHLADQLLLPMALAGSGAFVTGEPSAHARTNRDVIRVFLDVGLELEPLEGGRTLVRAGPPRAQG
jgi:RNA 3'-terminal phosphate cyclase (ATP)